MSVWILVYLSGVGVAGYCIGRFADDELGWGDLSIAVFWPIFLVLCVLLIPLVVGEVVKDKASSKESK